MKASTQATIITALLTSAASAQYAINPNTVPESTREFWCEQQVAQCPLICLDTEGSTELVAQVNECDPEQLTYGCVCDNGISPNVSEYSQTLPYFICTEWGNQCVSNCGNGNTACQSDCRENNPCGAQDPTPQNTSTLTSTMSSTASMSEQTVGATVSDGGVIATESGATVTLYGVDPTEVADESSANRVAHVRVWALSTGQTFGSMALIGGLIGGFAVLL